MKKKETGSIYTEIDARIIPKSSRNEIIIGEGDPVKIKVTSPPVDGKANKAVVNLLAKQLKVSKKDIQIVSGEKSRNKKIRIYGVSRSEFLKLTG
ncbi:MAG: DUF167 domain-containing protein [Desulfobacteraceae bacterium]|jgi:uncharacterized protein (TIGR00251 family)